MTSWLWLFVPGTPIAAALLILRWPGLHRLVWAAPLPAVLVGLAAPDARILTGLWPGAHWGLADPLARVLLLFFCALWALAGLFAFGSQQSDPHRSRFWVFWLLSLAGNLMLVLAMDAASFYVGFTLMSLMAFGLVIHNGTPAARRAGRLYLQLAILGELILFAGLMLRVHETGGSLVLADWHSTPVGLTTLLCLILGFGLKAGFWPLHIWLPVAHPAAPPAASAVLSGAMIKAGILGFWRFLPGPDSAGATPLLQDASAWLFGLGMFSAWYGIAVGLLQHRDKTALAYSSVSQVGYLLMIVALYLAGNASAESLAVLLGFYIVHHGFAKGALFLGAGMAHEIRLRPWHWGMMALPALALAAYPLTTGAVAKTLLKDSLNTSPFAHWEAALSWGSAATLLLVVRAVWLMYRSQPAKQDADRSSSLPRTWLLSWGTLCLAAPFLPWLWPEMREALLGHLSLSDFRKLMEPLLAAVAILVPAIWFNLHPARLSWHRFQPALRVSLYLRRNVQIRPLQWRKPEIVKLRGPRQSGARQVERYWNRLAGDPTRTTVWVLAFALLLSSLMTGQTIRW